MAAHKHSAMTDCAAAAAPHLPRNSRFLSALALLFSFAVASTASTADSAIPVSFGASPPVVDGSAEDAVWQAVPWRAIDQRWLGPAISSDDFSARYKMVWTEERLYLLVHIVDDVLYDGHRDPLVQYWDDDCLEIFLDEDASGGEHHHSHNAFAYHLSLDNRAIDIGEDGKAREYTEHVHSQWRQQPEGVIWEVSLLVYGDDYTDTGSRVEPRALALGKVLGFMIAYCDNDGSPLRENFIGSAKIRDGAKDRGYLDADVFDTIVLVEQE